MKKLMVVLSVALVVALVVAGVAGVIGGGQTPSVYASRLAGIDGAGATGIQVQNLDAAQAAQVVADFYKQGGAAPVSIPLPSIAPLGAYNIYLPSEAKLTNGAYAAIISGDRQLAAIARTEWAQSGGAALYSNVAPSTMVALPLATKKYTGQNSLVSIQNTDPNQQAQVTLKLYQTGNSTPVLTKQYSIDKGTSITLDMEIHPDFAAIPTPFLGSLTVESATPVGVQSFVDIETSPKAVYAFEGVPAEQAADKLFAPLFRNEFYGTTGISVVNPGTTDVQVTVKFAGSLGSCVGQAYTQGPATIAPGSSAVFYQANVNIPGSGMSPLPKNCAGAATIEATGGKVLAIVNDASGNPAAPTTSAAYNAVTTDLGSKKVALPLYRNKHTGAQLTTGIQAMNIGTAVARAEIAFTLSNGTQISGAGCGGACQQNIDAGASYTWYPPSIAALPANQYGSAFINSDQPLAVIVNDASLTGGMDAAIYNGIKADLQ
jgi:hypothetical protein